MSDLVAGAEMYLALPVWPKWTTAAWVAVRFGVTKRTAQRRLRALENAGLAFTDWEPGTDTTHVARWWRA